ncbi:MAG TPA: polysaccharide lyase 6 family protein [Verrucomicrobiae bacterium]
MRFAAINLVARILAVASFIAPAPVLAADRPVTNKTQFSAVMPVVQPGDVIVWKDGIYNDQSTITFEPTNQGTALAPITLRPETPGGVTFRGNSKLAIGGHHLVVTGFRFDNSSFTFSGSNTVVSVIDFRASSTISRHAYDCRVTQCTIVNYDNPVTSDTSKWILMYGATNRFDHNFTSGKRTRGAVLVVELNAPPDQIEAAHRIDHNVFADRTPGPLLNEYETVRVGTSSYSDQNAHVIVDHNYFHQCSGEAEFVSNKSCENTYRDNTFVECAGSLTLRHGRGCLVEGNLFFGNNVTNSGGIRVCNQDHLIINNYLQDLAGTGYQAGLGLMDGTTPTTNSNPDLSGSYVQVSNVVVAHNTMVNAAESVVYGVGKGGSGRTKAPRDCTLAANILVATQSPIFTLTDTPTNITYLSNLVWGASTGLSANPGLIAANPQLSADVFGIQRPASGGPAAGTAATQSLLSGDLLDLDGALRPLTGRDIGADQIGRGSRPVAPLSATEVGPFWMQPTGPVIVYPALTSGGPVQLSIRAPGTAWARLLAVERAPGPAGTWVQFGPINEADDDGIFSVVDDPMGANQFYWRAFRQ